jgi:hypothetical protein
MVILRRLWTGWKRVAEKVARLQTAILLTLLYILLVLPFGIMARLFADPLGIRPASGGSWWRARPSPRADLDTARRQF